MPATPKALSPDQQKSKATPGPWRYDPKTYGIVMADDVGAHIAEIVDRGGDADGYLIAAAPEMAVALQDVLNMLEAAHRDLGMFSKDNKRVINACAVLAKARGKV